MYTFNIETIHDKNIVTGNDKNIVGHDKIVGGGTQFKVYRASDINGLFGDLTENYKPSIQAFTDGLSIGALCDYYFSYVIYDTFDNEKFRYKFFFTALQQSIEKKLLQIQEIRTIHDIQTPNYEVQSTIIQHYTNDINKENRMEFCTYIWSLFDIKSGQQATQLPYIDFLSDNSLVLSEGQYLNHLDEIYSNKYSLIIQKYKEHIDDIEDDDEYNDFEKDEKYLENKTKFLEKYNKEKDEIINNDQAYVNEKEIPDEKYIVLHLLFLNKTYIDPKGEQGEQGKHKSYLLLIDEKYASLDVIKEQNLFYNTNKMFIRNKEEFLKSIKIKIKEEATFQTLSEHNGIEKLLNIYYAYIPHKNTPDDIAIHQVFNDLSIKISNFFIKNKNIYNLLVFNDTIFFKMIKDDLILTLYDLEKQFEHKFGSIRESEDNIHFDIEQGYTIDTEYIKQMMLYRYKQLEQTIRRLYLEKYSKKKIILDSENNYFAPKFYEIINKRTAILNRGFAFWNNKLQGRYLTRMIDVIYFYRIGRLVEYLVPIPLETSNEGVESGSESTSDRYIGVIRQITELTYTIKRLSKIPLVVSDADVDDSISIYDIRETEYILCDEVIASEDASKRREGWTPSAACESEDVKIKYRDIELFDPIYDIEIYTIQPGDIKLNLKETPKCLVLRSAIIVDHKHRKKQTMQFAQQGITAQDNYSDDFEVIDLHTETYVSVYTIDKNSLTLLDCFSVCNKKRTNIENMIDDPMKTYTDDKLFCFLIEKISNETIVNTEYPCDTLFFINGDKKDAILALK